MSVVVAIETSTESFGVAVMVGDDVNAFQTIVKQGHAELIAAHLPRLMSESGVTPAMVDWIGYGRGPGAFTGVRIGLAAAQGLGMGWDRPLVGVSSLVSMAYGFALTHLSERERADNPSMFSALDARLGEIYWSSLRLRDCEQVTVPREALNAPQDVVGDATTGVDYGVGHGFLLDPTLAPRLGVARVAGDALPSVVAVARLAALYQRQGAAVSAPLAQAVYLRDQVAHGKPMGQPTGKA
jgi:tRNA threonylcarbamoyladenosine biosynthesis protein TsaB